MAEKKNVNTNNKTNNKEDISKKVFLYIILVIVIIIVTVVGTTLAYFSAFVQNDTDIKGSTGSTSLDIQVNKISTSATLDLIPLDNDLETLNKAALGHYNTTSNFDATKACIDINNYSVCQLYEIVVTNTGTVNISLNGGVTSLTGENTPNIACAVMDNNTTVSDNSTCVGTTTLASNTLLTSGSSNTYYVLVYINNLDVPQKDKGEFTGTVEFQSGEEGKVTARFN